MPMFKTGLIALFVLVCTAVPMSDTATASRASIDADVNATLNRFFARVTNGRELATKAEAVLVFP